jgi:hypothetical protein
MHLASALIGCGRRVQHIDDPKAAVHDDKISSAPMIDEQPSAR